MDMGTATRGVDAAALLRLFTWMSPAFPVGAFGYSHGLETVVRDGRVRDAETLSAWIAALVELGSGWTDAVLLKAAWQAVDVLKLAELAELAAALAPSLERRRETLGQGEAFLHAVRAWGEPSLSGPTAYPVAVGACARSHGLSVEPVLAGFLHAFAANLVGVAIRAIPLGQTGGVAAMAMLEPLLLQTTQRALASDLEDLGACTILSDIAAMRHETLPGRLFIS